MKVEQKEIEIRRERIRKQQIDWKSQERIRREEIIREIIPKHCQRLKAPKVKGATQSSLEGIFKTPQ